MKWILSTSYCSAGFAPSNQSSTDRLQGQREFLVGGSIGLGFDFDKNNALEKRKARLAEILKGGDVTGAHATVTVSVLQALFPAIARIMNDQETSNLPRLDARRIADDFYFDRYFNFGVPGDDLPDATVRTALNELGRLATASTERLEEHLASDTRRTIQKIERERAHTPEASAAIVRWALEQYMLLPEQNGWLSPRDQLANFLAGPLVDANTASYPDFVREALHAGIEPTYMLLDATRSLVGRYLGNGAEIRLWNQRGEKLQAELFAEFPKLITEAATKPVFDVHPYVLQAPIHLGWVGSGCCRRSHPPKH
ncbi:hypothetical protein KIV56_17095 [Cryobacterium breve]|uniref:Uncharacterized protein n=1 Tax=Cryobacterium breve TaxID=1259258 RepID=A0ABY7NBI2_9MICO|nr:hypothetical protein [Cryobacterium breve]WBM79863.1 hypothetical protein KIV56_17095 [Cryobacterium breve]